MVKIFTGPRTSTPSYQLKCLNLVWPPTSSLKHSPTFSPKPQRWEGTRQQWESWETAKKKSGHGNSIMIKPWPSPKVAIKLVSMRGRELILWVLMHQSGSSQHSVVWCTIMWSQASTLLTPLMRVNTRLSIRRPKWSWWTSYLSLKHTWVSLTNCQRSKLSSHGALTRFLMN